MRLDDRSDAVLRTADLLGGGVAMQVVYASFPEVHPDVLRRLIARLVHRRALAAVRVADLGGRVYLTTAGTIGRLSGVRHYLKDPALVNQALESGRVRKTVKLPVTFVHDQLAGLVSIGLSGGIAETEHEIRVQQDVKPATVADGYSWPEADRRLVIEIERMVGQSPHRWTQRNGLVEKIARSLLPDNSHPRWHDEYVVVAPRSLNRLHPDTPAELAELVTKAASKNYQNREGAGWWFLPIDDLDADPEWHPVLPDSPPPRSLPGIRSRRQSFAGEHEDFAKIDRARKDAAAARTTAEGGSAAAIPALDAPTSCSVSGAAS